MKKNTGIMSLGIILALIYVLLVEILKSNYQGGRSNMKTVSKQNLTKDKQTQMNFFRMLDRGIDDMEAGRELPLEEAFQKISELRNTRIYKNKTIEEI